ncbi:MAG: PHP domain-containing protein [Clostridia bacterium]|nr:PHP domain-containing protein [Clostridia bacterium]
MKIYLLPEGGTFYKANLHCHSTLSDGHWTVEQIKENYKAHGYSIVAYTDHDVFLTHNDLADEDFLPLNGYELAFGESKVWTESPKTCHTCFIALDKDRTAQNIYYNSKHFEANKDKVDIPVDKERIHREYSPEFISKIMTEGRRDGFFVTYNHPVWSLEAGGEYMGYHGMHAMEIVNYSSYASGHEERNGIIYDNMLSAEKGLYCVATDDNHDKYPIGHPKCDSFGGFTMIKAEKLEYSAVTKALLDGSFYASEGPEIRELYFEDGQIHIKTSDAVRIAMIAESRYNQRETPERIGETINEAVFAIDKKVGSYVRFVIRDREGKEAYTNAYSLDSLPIEQ